MRAHIKLGGGFDFLYPEKKKKTMVAPFNSLNKPLESVHI